MPPPPLCSRCGGRAWTELGGGEWRCDECGLGATVQTMHSRRVPRWRRRREAPLRAAQARRRDDIAAATFPPYGLDDRWTGPRWVGGHGRSNDRVTHLGLAHGTTGAAGPQLRVDTRIPHRGSLDIEVALAARELVMGLVHETGAMREDVRRAAFPLGGSPDPLAPWAPLTVPVDGTPSPFRLLAEGEHWIAVGRLPTVVVTLEGREWDPGDVGLVEIRDLAPYGG